VDNDNFVFLVFEYFWFSRFCIFRQLGHLRTIFFKRFLFCRNKKPRKCRNQIEMIYCIKVEGGRKEEDSKNIAEEDDDKTFGAQKIRKSSAISLFL